MSDQDFRERVLSALERLEQKSERMEEKFDKKFASIEEKFDKKFASMEQKSERMEEKFDKRFESIETRLGLLEQSVSWIRGKLEGKMETGTILWTRIAVGTAVVSAIIALFALFKS